MDRTEMTPDETKVQWLKITLIIIGGAAIFIMLWLIWKELTAIDEILRLMVISK